MARWKPRTAKEVMEARIVRIDEQIKEKEQDIKNLKEERKQAEAAVKAMGS